MSHPKKITIIGGYPATLRTARLGVAVILIEKAKIGGTCPNRGYIPTKSLLQSVEVTRTVNHAINFSIQTGEPTIDFHRIVNRENIIVYKLRKGIESLVAEKNKSN